MKTAATFTLLAFSLLAYGQESHRTNLHIYTGDCRMEKHVLLAPDTVWLDKGSDSTKKVIVSIGWRTQDPIVIENLQPGGYQLHFVNNFGQHIEKNISIPDSPEYTVRICPDELTKNKINTLSKLKPGEFVLLRFKETSCFGHSNARLKIARKNNYFLASLQTYENGKTNLMAAKLTKKMEFAFTRFENELRFIKKGRSTTRDYYTMESKFGSFSKMDGTCNWNGFYFLKRSLFGPEKREFEAKP